MATFFEQYFEGSLSREKLFERAQKYEAQLPAALKSAEKIVVEYEEAISRRDYAGDAEIPINAARFVYLSPELSRLMREDSGDSAVAAFLLGIYAAPFMPDLRRAGTKQSLIEAAIAYAGHAKGGRATKLVNTVDEKAKLKSTFEKHKGKYGAFTNTAKDLLRQGVTGRGGKALDPKTVKRRLAELEEAEEVSFNGGINWYAASDFIHVEQAPDRFPPGDYNKDKIVDAADFVVWRRTFGKFGAGLTADGDWSGKVDSGDYDVWHLNFGQTAADGSLAGENVAVPEPATLLMLLIGILSMCYCRRVVTS